MVSEGTHFQFSSILQTMLDGMDEFGQRIQSCRLFSQDTTVVLLLSVVLVLRPRGEELVGLHVNTGYAFLTQ